MRCVKGLVCACAQGVSVRVCRGGLCVCRVRSACVQGVFSVFRVRFCVRVCVCVCVCARCGPPK